MTSRYDGPRDRGYSDWRPQRREQGSQRRERQPSAQLPGGYLDGGYYDDNGNLRPEVVTAWAKKVAQVLDEGQMKMAQLRNFFGATRMIEQRLRSGNSFESVRGSIARMEPLAAASVGRDNAPRVFLSFIERNVAEAQKDRKSFDAFLYHFEAIVAYKNFLNPRN